MHRLIHLQYVPRHTLYNICMHAHKKCANIHVKIQFKPRALSVFVSSVIYMNRRGTGTKRPGKARCSAIHR